LSAVVCGVATIALLAFVVAMRMPLTGYSPSNWAALLGLGIVCQLAGHVLIAYAMGRLPATTSSVTLLGQAPATAVLATLLLGERLGWLQVAGGALVLGGIYVVNRSRAAPVGVPTTPDG
jgi:drug/metabolite transporter (DMT)-like permease